MIVIIKTDVTLEYLNKLDNEKNMIPLTFDRLLKAFFENNQDIYKKFINNVLHLELDSNEMDIEIKNTELPVSHYNEYRKTVDFNVDINKNILLNIELNRTHFNSVKFRNYIYQATKIGHNLKKGDSKNIKERKKIKNIQLNLNVVDKSENLEEDIVVPYSIVTNSINDITYIRYLDYYKNLYYMDDAGYWLAMLMANNYVELNDILSKFLDDE